jgi:hypothetical protein
MVLATTSATGQARITSNLRPILTSRPPVIAYCLYDNHLITVTPISPIATSFDEHSMVTSFSRTP